MRDILRLIEQSSDLKLLLVILLLGTLTVLVLALIKARNYAKKDFPQLFNRRRSIDDTLATINDLNSVKNRLSFVENKLKQVEASLIALASKSEIDADKFVEVVENQTKEFGELKKEFNQLNQNIVRLIQETIRTIR